MLTSIECIAIVCISNKCENINNFKLPKIVKTKIIFEKTEKEAIEKAKILGATHIAILNCSQIIDNNWLINQIDFYNKQKEELICYGVTYKKYKNDYPDFIINNRFFMYILKKNLIREKLVNSNKFFSINAVENSSNKSLINYNSVSYQLINNISIPMLIYKYLCFVINSKKLKTNR